MQQPCANNNKTKKVGHANQYMLETRDHVPLTLHIQVITNWNKLTQKLAMDLVTTSIKLELK